jgi:hypothetical protein
MSGYGGIGAMISSMKYNRAQAHIKKSPKDTTIGGRGKLINQPLRFRKKMSNAAYLKFSHRLRREKQKSIVFQSIIYSSIIVITLIFILWLSNL